MHGKIEIGIFASNSCEYCAQFGHLSIYIIKTRLLCVYLFVCLSGLYESDGRIETAFIIEIKPNFQM